MTRKALAIPNCMPLDPQITAMVLIAGTVLSAGATWADEKDGRWIDAADPTIPVDVKYQGEYVGKLEDGGELGCQVVSLGDGVFQAVLYSGGLPGAGWDGKNRSIMDGKLTGDSVSFTAASGERKHVAATRGMEKQPSSTRVSLVTKFPPSGHKPCEARIVGDKMTGVADGTPFTLSRTIRTSPTLGQKPPSGAIVLFDGSHMKEWTGGSINEKFGTLMPQPRDLMSRRSFNNYTIHLEFMLPYQPAYRNQDRGNSGFYQVHDYEIQVLDSFGMDGAHNECGGIYSHKGSDVNMCLPPLVWQTFDVEFTNSVAKDGKKVKDAVISVRHNGVLIHDGFAIPGKSQHGVRRSPEGTPGPIKLQNHRETLQYRHIWIVPHGPVPELPPSTTANKPPKKPPVKPAKATIELTAPTTDAAKAMIGKWHIRFQGNNGEYLLELKADGSSHLGRTGNPAHFKREGSDAELCPVEMVSHLDARIFCETASKNMGAEFRLLTVAQWEYAYRSGTRTKYYNGDDDAKATDLAQCTENNFVRTAKVGTKLPNAFGLYDMGGNVSEWCADFWDREFVETKNIDPQGPQKPSKLGRIRVHRGNAWDSYARTCHATSGGASSETYGGSQLGFRLARVAKRRD